MYLLFKSLPVKEGRDIVGSESLSCSNWHRGSNLMKLFLHIFPFLDRALPERGHAKTIKSTMWPIGKAIGKAIGKTNEYYLQ